MRIKVELVSGRAISGTVAKGDESRLQSREDPPSVTALPTEGWITLIGDDDDLTVVNLAQVEAITELPE